MVDLVRKYPSTTVLADPTQMSDSLATKLGLKSYAHGTTYNAGIAPTITLTAGGGTLNSVDFSTFIPYQLQDGIWRLRGNITVTLSSAARTTAQLTINGVTFNSSQAIAAFAATVNADTSIGRVNNGSSAMDLTHLSATTSTYYFSFDVRVLSKPTWAY